MKKILAMLGALGLTTTSAITVMACNNNNTDEIIKGLKATDFSTKLYGAKGAEDVYSIIFELIHLKTLTKAQQDEVSNEEKGGFFNAGFNVSFKLAENTSFPLKKDDKITITISKFTDEEIKTYYKKLYNEDIPPEWLNMVMKYQKYVSGNKFSAEITITEPPKEEQNNN
ncbi:lipoprotein [Spiroplasma sp. SV19]|uniref:lipoprotein n=1 Tax=Spiroplasma sp. SV19 TaxID=2570468 RepID=UPI0024B776AF|nr:lipoprotein [Spiroplasma sp. SV19]WHQ36496.1 hypothetical protein E7Y35_00900 [Spiroplasma sp. SV19]